MAAATPLRKRGSTAPHSVQAPVEIRPPIQTTLLELVQLIEELTDDDQLVVATVVDLLQSGDVRLIGNFRDQKLTVD